MRNSIVRLLPVLAFCAFVSLSSFAAADDKVKLSVISDINNTIRAGGAVPGMEEAYKRLVEKGAVFHYISYSSWSEAEEIKEFLGKWGFPEGTLHLRGSKGGFFDFAQRPSDSKPPAIRKLLEENPDRRFILIGDSGWQDPEIYGAIARAYPGRIKHIYIRRVTSEAPRDARFRQAFSGLEDAQWTVFTDPKEIKAE